MGLLNKLFRKKKNEDLRAVEGAGVYKGANGKVIYNMLDPSMGKFMGQCVGAVKKAGIKAKGTGQFSILLDDDQDLELALDQFWANFQKSEDKNIFSVVVEAARKMTGK